MAIKIQNEAGYSLIQTDQPVFSDEEAKHCISALNAQTEHRPLVVLNFLNVTELGIAALRTLTRGVSILSQQEIRVAMVAKPEVLKLVLEQGLNRLFSCYTELSEIIPTPGPDNSKQRALEFLNTSLEAVAYTLKVTTNTPCTAEKSYIRGQGPATSPDIAATVGLVSEPFNGTLILGFPTQTYLGIMSRLLNQEYKEITPEIRDGAAELLNIILGTVKTALNEKGFALKQAIPTVVHGKAIQIMPVAGRPSVIVPYKSDVGDFYIELMTNPK